MVDHKNFIIFIILFLFVLLNVTFHLQNINYHVHSEIRPSLQKEIIE
jgi:hypothetical protein